MKALSFLITEALFLVYSVDVNSQSSITVNGAYTYNQVWNADTVKIAGDVNIAGRLDILPGTYVEFMGHYVLTSNSMYALGSLGDSITFTIHDTTGFSNRNLLDGGWNRIFSHHAEFDFCIIEYGKYFDNYYGLLSNVIKLENSRIASNICSGFLIYFYSTQLTPHIINCRFEDDFCYSLISHEFGTQSVGISNCQFYRNSFKIGPVPEIINCYFENNKEILIDKQIGYIDPSVVLSVKNCIFIRNTYLSIHSDDLINSLLDDNILYVNTINLAGNLICNNTLGIYVYNEAGPYIVNNTFYNNSSGNDSTSVILTFDCPDLHFYNNILYSNGNNYHEKAIIKFMAGNSYPTNLIMPMRGTIKNNLIEGGLGIIECAMVEGKYVDNIDTDPLFIDTSASHFHLSDNSPCINIHTLDTTGLFLLSSDLDGNPRIYGPSVDMGAYEYQGLPVNRSPVIENIRNKKLLPGNTPISVTFYDPDQGDHCTVMNVSSDVPEINIHSIVPDTTSVQFIITSDSGWQGTGNIQIQVSDNHSNLTLTTFQVTFSQFIQGKILGNTVWDSDTIKVTGDVSVFGTLTIRPGTYIELQGHYEISADTILAMGSPGDSITFTINDTVGFNRPDIPEGGWKGLSAAYYMDIDHCRIMFVKNHNLLYIQHDIIDLGRIRNSVLENNICGTLVTCLHEWFGWCYYTRNKIHINYTSFKNNHFDDLGSTGLIDNCRFTGNSISIRGNIISSYFGNNKKLRFSAEECLSMNIHQCLFENSDTLNIECGSFGSLSISSSLFINNNNTLLNCYEPNNITIVNNTFFNNHIEKGFNALLNFSGPVDIYNNILCSSYNDSVQAKLISFKIRGTVGPLAGFILNNLIEGGLEAIEYNGTGYNEGIFDVDPLFVDTLHNDFHLTAQSPCINYAGFSNIYMYLNYGSHDLDGNPRIYGTYADIGAYEYQGKPDNRPPIIEIVSTPKILPGISKPLTLRFFDPDSGDICSVSNVISETPKVKVVIIAADSNSMKINITADNDWQGTGHILIQVADNHDHIATYEFPVIVSKVVCGELSSNAVWGGDTVKIECDVIIGIEDTLTIQPGTTVSFAKNCRLMVKGLIMAVGNDSSRITFTSSDTSGFYQDDYIGWGGISNYSRNQYFSSMGIFKYCDFQYSTANSTYSSTIYWRTTDNYGDSLIVTNCNFYNNHSNEDGGAIFIHSHAIIQNSIFYNNKTEGSGGAIYIDYPSVDVFNCEFLNNYALHGGAIYGSASPAFRNCLFVNNSAEYGGAIASNWLKLINSTVCENNAEISGGGAECLGDGIMINCIFWNNNAGLSGNEIKQDYGSLRINNSIIKGGIYGISFSDTLPANSIFSANPYFKNSSANDFHLSDSSFAINTGTNDTTGLYLPGTDLDGSPRITDHYIDIGAYEYHCDTVRIDIQPESFIACSGDEGQLEINASGIVTGYQWQKNGTDLPGATGRILLFPSLKLSDEGIYQGIAKNTSCSDTTGPIVVKVNPLPSPILGNDTAFCASATLILAPKKTYPDNTWNTGSRDDSIVIINSGIYWLAVTDSNGCSNTDSIYVTINPMPYVYLGNDTSIKTTDTLHLNAGDGFEKYLWNTGYDDQLLLVHKNLSGEYEYWVLVTNTNGCSSGDTVIVTVEQATRVFDNLRYTDFRIYPNPTSGILKLISEINMADVRIEIYDMKGQFVLQKKIEQLIAGETYLLNLSILQPGVYQLQVGERIMKIIKDR
jgi:hypothetical protein